MRSEKFSLLMAVLVMLLAAWALPYPGSIVLGVVAALGGLAGVVIIRRRSASSREVVRANRHGK